MQPRDVVLHTFADQRFSTRDANLADAQAQENSRQAVEFRPGKNLIVIAIILGVGRAAVDAAEVAAVGNRDAQVRNLATEFILKGHDLVPSDRCLNKNA